MANTPSPVHATYRGRDRGGAGRLGSVLATEIGGLVRRSWRNGWSQLSVYINGQEVGGITALDGKRYWWVEARYVG